MCILNHYTSSCVDFYFSLNVTVTEKIKRLQKNWVKNNFLMPFDHGGKNPTKIDKSENADTISVADTLINILIPNLSEISHYQGTHHFYLCPGLFCPPTDKNEGRR